MLYLLPIRTTMKLKKIACLFYTVLFVFLIPTIAVAQCDPLDPGGNPDDAPTCPIDDGLVFLIIAAVCIAVKKYCDTRQKISVT